MAEDAQIYDLAAEAMEKLYGGDGPNLAVFKRNRGLMSNMFGDMVNEGWWSVERVKKLTKQSWFFCNKIFCCV